MKKIIVAMILSLFIINCGQCKKAGTLRCHENKVQVCGGDKRWKLSRDCSKIKNTSCGKYKDVTTCVYKKPEVRSE